MTGVKIKKAPKLLPKITANKGGSRTGTHSFVSWTIALFSIFWPGTLTVNLNYLSSSTCSFSNSIWGWEYLGIFLLSYLTSETFHWWNAGEAFCGHEKKKRCYFKHCWESLGKIHLADNFFRSKTHQALQTCNL